MDWTILQPHHFMENLLTQTQYIINDGVIYAPSGDGKIPYVDSGDIAAVAFVTLSKPGHGGKTYVTHRKRSDFLPSGDRDHQQGDRQAAPFRRRDHRTKHGRAESERAIHRPSSKAFSPSVLISEPAEKR